MRLRVGNALIRVGSSRLAVGSAGATTYASTFAVSLSAPTGPLGTTRTATVTPIGGAWTPGQPVALSVSGVACSVSPDSRTGSGTSAVTFSFTPSVAGLLTVDAIAVNMTSTGAQNYTATAITQPVGTANRVDILLDMSSVAPGATVTGAACPNGLWPTTAGRTITLNNGTVISLPTTGSAPVTFSFTAGAAGEYLFTSTNNAGLYNPYGAPLTVFAASSGAAQTITASLTRLDKAILQRDTASGNPAGFSTGWSKGWGEVWLTLNTSGPALFMKLYDALSTGATSVAGSGTALSGIVQVHGPFTAGTVRVLPPAGPYIYRADVATDSAFTNPVRLAQRFGVGVDIAALNRSYECGLVLSFADSAAYSNIYTKTMTFVSANTSTGANASTNAAWFQQGVDSTFQLNGDPMSGSLGAQEMGRLLESQLGVCVGITGHVAAGGGFDGQVAHDGTLCTGFRDTVNFAVGNKFRYFYAAGAGWDGVDGAYPTETYTEDRTRYLAAIDYVARTYPACAVQAWCVGQSAYAGPGGSAAGASYARLQSILLNEVEPANPMVVSKENYLYIERVSGHASAGSRIDYIRPSFRQMMATEISAMGGLQTSARGPLLAASGTASASGRTITLGFTLATGASLTKVGATASDPVMSYNTASNSEIASLFGVYATGNYYGNGTPIKISSATIDNTAKTITLTLFGSSGVTYMDNTTGPMPSGFWVNYACDIGASNVAAAPWPTGNSRSVMLADDRTGNGIPYGWHMRPALDIPVSVGA